MPSNEDTLLKAFNASAKAIAPGTADSPDLLGAINHLVDALTIFSAANTGTNTGDQNFKLLPFTGVDGSGETPELTCAFTGAPLNATVAAIIDTADFSDARSLFETSISAAGHIEQISLTDLSAKNYLALLVSK